MNSLDFLLEYFCKCPIGDVELRRIPNVEGVGKAERVFSSDPVSLQRYINGWTRDESDHGIFFGASQRHVGSQRGRKEDIKAVPALWVDLDADKHGWNVPRTIAALKTSPVRPSLIIQSGHGLHLYWLLENPIRLPMHGTDEWFETVNEIEALNKRLAVICGGDNVQDITRVLRLPGTHNTKKKSHKSVDVVLDDWTEWNFADLKETAANQTEYLTDRGWMDAELVRSMLKAKKFNDGTGAIARAYGSEAGLGDRSFTWQSLWAHTVYGGGGPRDDYVGLDEAVLRATAILWARLGGEAPDDTIVESVLAEVQRIKQRDAPHEIWDWDAERGEIQSKLERFKPRFQQHVEAARKNVEKRPRKRRTKSPDAQ